MKRIRRFMENATIPTVMDTTTKVSLGSFTILRHVICEICVTVHSHIFLPVHSRDNGAWKSEYWHTSKRYHLTNWLLMLWWQLFKIYWKHLEKKKTVGTHTHLILSMCLPQIDHVTGMVMNLTDLKRCIEVRSSENIKSPNGVHLLDHFIFMLV